MFHSGPAHSHQQLNEKIKKLEYKISSASHPIIGWTEKWEWDGIFDLAKEIQDDFKGIHYPTKLEREEAWQLFHGLREKAYEEKRRQRHQRSLQHFDPIMSKLRDVDYDILGDIVVGHLLSFGVLKANDDEMRDKGKRLGEIIRLFNASRHEMTKEHQEEIQEKITRVRNHHNQYWENSKEQKQALHKARADGKAAAKEKARQRVADLEYKLQDAEERRNNIKENIEKNKEKLSNAHDALQRFRNNRDNLRDQISESNNSNWIEKAEGWLQEAEDRIDNIEDQIERYEGWIQEGREQLEQKDEYIDKLREWLRQARDRFNSFD